MKRDLNLLTNQSYDLLIIGGGILGAGIARDAALRGLRVALVDKADFASGTSSASSKLIHGGFRYLEQGAFSLVAEACRERYILQQIAPHLVRPLPFLLPVYDGDQRGLGRMRLGMTLYDLLARYRNTAPHRVLSPAEALTREPSLEPRGLRGAILYYDCQTDDARFCLDNILHAAACGAVCANYCEVTGFVARGEHLVAARVADRQGTVAFEIAAGVFINAAGPWVEHVAGLSACGSQQIALSPTKGVHLLVSRPPRQHGISFQARRDGRFLIAVPWDDCLLVGSTDTDFTGDPATARTEPADSDYLLEALRQVMPGDRTVVTAFAGVRPLLRSGARAWRRSREHQIVQHGANFFSVAGGKYTTYRLIAEQMVNRLSRVPCRTATTPLPVFAGDVAHSCAHEMALTVGDVMRRRTRLALSRNGGPDTAAAVAQQMAAALGWSEAQRREQLERYVNEWRRNQP